MGELGKRVALAISLPLMAVLMLAVVVVQQWRTQLDWAETGRAAAVLAVEAAAVVTALQEERSASTALLSGAAFSADLAAGRATVDARVAHLRAALARRRAAREENGLRAHLDSVRTALARVPELRRRVDMGEADPLANMNAYTTIINTLIRTLDAAALEIGIPELTSRVHAYDRLMTLKEYAARERGLGAALLAAAEPERDLYQAHADSLMAQRALLEQFREAPPGSPDRHVLRLIGGDPQADALAPLRAVLAQPGRLRSSDPAAARSWFALTIARIQTLAAGLETLAAEMGATADALGEQARWRFFGLGAVVVLLVGLLAWLGWHIGRRLLLQLEAERHDAAHMLYLGRHDPLTGLPNRGYFQELLEAQRRHTLEEGEVLALHLLDIADFKEINRVWGIGVGDAVIVEVARRLLPLAAGQPRLARFEGDQFALIQAPIADRADAERFAREIVQAFEAPVQVDERVFPLRVRVGVTLFPPDARTYELLVRNADLARQHVDGAGRAGYRLYVSEMYERYMEARTLALELRSADPEKEFVLYYQPKLAAGDRRLLGAEALIRWNHPSRGRLEPASFIAMAEDSGDIVKIGRWVVNEVCRQAAAWQRAGLVPPVLAFNLSAAELRQLGLVKALREAIELARLDPRLLEVEITETAVISDLEDTLRVLRQIRALGVGLAIDDFGTGYSSLTYLHRFPATSLKLDRSFVITLETSSESEHILDAVIAIAHGLSLRVVAEGVETEQQLELLRKKGCDEFQGYLLAPPMTAAELGERLPRMAPSS